MDQLVAIDSSTRLGEVEKRQEKQSLYLSTLGMSSNQTTHGSSILPLHYDSHSLDVMSKILYLSSYNKFQIL